MSVMNEKVANDAGGCCSVTSATEGEPLISGGGAQAQLGARPSLCKCIT